VFSKLFYAVIASGAKQSIIFLDCFRLSPSQWRCKCKV